MALSESALVAQRDAVLATMAALTLSPKPSYTIEGRSIQYEQYLAELRAQITALNLLIDLALPVEQHSEAYS